MVYYEPPDPEQFPHAKRFQLSPIENEYMLMFRALEDWHICPWIDPITKEEYPEVRFSMFKMAEYRNRRIRRDHKKAEAEARLKR